MKLSDFDRLKKFMDRTTSNSDPEALTALRAANKLLAAEGRSWSQVLDRLCHVENDVEAMPQEPSADDLRREINEAFETVEASDPSGGFASFMASLREQWDSKQYLSGKQKDALFKAADNARGRRR